MMKGEEEVTSPECAVTSPTPTSKEGPRVQCNFIMPPPPKKRAKQPTIYKVSGVNAGPPPVLPPPPGVAAKLSQCGHMFAIDVETHDLAPRSLDLYRDQFGLMAKTPAHVLSSLRIIQLGWAVGNSIDDAVAYSRFVRPDGFFVHPRATKLHRISHEMVASEGVPLREALKTMVTMASECCAHGSHLVSHNLSFDAGIVYEELGCSGLEGMQGQWKQIARQGICTMDPDVVSWARCMIGIGEVPRCIPAKLVDLVSELVPSGKSLVDGNHDARSDAIMHPALCHELVTRCRSMHA